MVLLKYNVLKVVIVCLCHLLDTARSRRTRQCAFVKAVDPTQSVAVARIYEVS